MGFFSWECPVCGVSIRSKWASCPQDECTVVLPDKTVSGIYDGYGRIELSEEDQNVTAMEKFCITDNLQSDNFEKEVKLYHTKCWESIGKPDFEEAKWSEYARDQGFFFGENDIG